MAQDSAATDDGSPDDNGLAFAGDRNRRRAAGASGRDRASARTTPADAIPVSLQRNRSFDAGDLPEGMEARYLIERGRLTGEQRYYENASDAKPAFRDRGDRLIADNDSRALVRDMLDIAEHRGWDRIRVSGSDAFRREAWREAALRDIAVDGYRPTPRERQEVARARATREATFNVIAPDGDQRRRPDDAADQGRGTKKSARSVRADFDAGVAGRLVDMGEDRYGDKASGRGTPYADIVLDDGRRERAWGVGLPAALRQSDAQVGDRIRLQRQGTERVEVTVAVLNAETGERSSEMREVNRNRWSAERVLTPELNTPSKVAEPSTPSSAAVERETPPGLDAQRKKQCDTATVDERGVERAVDAGDELLGVRTAPTRETRDRDLGALADRFRSATPAEAARDPELRAAQSQFVAAKAIVTSMLGHDIAAANRLTAHSRETIARAIEQGRTIPPAELRGDRTLGHSRDRRAPERAKGNDGSDPTPTITKAPTRNRSR